MADMNEVSQYIQATRGVLDILTSLGGLLPKGENAEAAKKRLAEAERALHASEAQLAKALDYHLCQCTFPPQIMLSRGYHPRHGTDEVFKCPGCGRQEPSEQHFRSLDQLAAYHAGPADPRAGY